MHVIGSDQSAYTLIEVREVIGRCVDFFERLLKPFTGKVLNRAVVWCCWNTGDPHRAELTGVLCLQVTRFWRVYSEVYFPLSILFASTSVSRPSIDQKPGGILPIDTPSIWYFVHFEHRFKIIRAQARTSSNSARLHQGCRNSGRRFAQATKFCVLAPDICGCSIQNFVSSLWRLEFRGGS